MKEKIVVQELIAYNPPLTPIKNKCLIRLLRNQLRCRRFYFDQENNEMELVLNLGKSYLRHFSGVSSKIWFGILLSLFESTLMGVFYFLSLFLVNDLSFNASSAGMIISFYGVGAIAGGIISGKICDQVSPHFVVICSLGLQAISYFLLSFLQDPKFLILNMVLLGMASYSFITANQLWVLNQCNENQKLKAINLLSTASNLGLAVSAVIVGLLYHYGFKFIFISTALILASVTTYLILNSNFKEKVRTSNLNNTAVIKAGYQNKSLILFILSAVFFVGLIVSQLGTTYPLYIHDNFSGIYTVSFLFALNSLVVVLFETPIGNVLGDFNKTFLVGISSFLIGFGMLILTFSNNIIAPVLGCLVYTLGEIIFFCMAQFICYEQALENKKGLGLGMFRMVYASSRVAGPVVGGYIYHHLGGNFVWYYSGAIGATFLLGGLLIANC